MATTDTGRAGALAEVRALLDGLGSRAPGAKLRAQDWNDLVGAVARVAQLAPDAAPAAEPATASVEFADLADDVQRLLRSGPFADPRERAAQGALERRLQAMETRVGDLGVRLEALLGTIRRSETEISRGLNQISKLGQRVDVDQGMQREVAGLRSLMGSLREDLSQALELRSSIGDTDLGKLAESVKGLEDFRSGWRDEAGSPVTFAVLDGRLAAIGDKAIGEEELASALDSRLAKIDLGADAIRATITADLREEIATTRAQLGAEVDRRTAATAEVLRRSVGEDIERAVGAGLGTVDARMTEIAQDASRETIAAELGTRDEALRAGLRTELDERALAQRDETSRLVDERTAAIDRRVETVAAEALGREVLQQELAAVETRLAGTIDGVAAGIRDESRLRAADAIVLRRERAEASAATARQLEGLLAESLRQEALERADAITAATASLAGESQRGLEQLRTSLRAEIGDAAATAVAAGAADIRSQLELNMRVIVGDAVAALESDIVRVSNEVSTLRGGLTTEPAIVVRPVTTQPLTTEPAIAVRPGTTQPLTTAPSGPTIRRIPPR